jgi:hypothetical protein
MLLPTSYEVLSDAKKEKNVIYGLFVNFIYMTEMLMEGRLRVYITGIWRCNEGRITGNHFISIVYLIYDISIQDKTARANPRIMLKRNNPSKRIQQGP